jgi:hypothetical protein
MQTIAQLEPNPQIRNNILLDCKQDDQLTRKLKEAQVVLQPGDTDRRQGSRARDLVQLLRRVHFHRAHCPACLLREAIGVGGVQ